MMALPSFHPAPVSYTHLDVYKRQAKYGLINDRANRLAYADDSSYYLLCALEVIDEDGKLERKADMFTKRTIKPDVYKRQTLCQPKLNYMHRWRRR